MLFMNNSGFHHSTFILTGLEQQEQTHLLISTLICFLYAVGIFGNGTILYLIITKHGLHAPMYYFLSALAVTDIALSMTTLPTILSVFLFNSREISIDACVSQLYFLNILTIMESGVLLAMSLDRFIAICHPLRYVSLLSKSMVVRIVLSFALRAIVLILPEPFLDRWLPFCRSNVLTHPWCLHQELITLACVDVRIHSYYGLFVVSTMISDVVLIVLSYLHIVKVVLRIASRKGRSKTLETCMSHIWAVFIFYVPIICLSVLHRFGNVIPHNTQKVLAYIFYLVPPVMNPVIYCLKNKLIHAQFVRLLIRKKVLCICTVKLPKFSSQINVKCLNGVSIHQ